MTWRALKAIGSHALSHLARGGSLAELLGARLRGGARVDPKDTVGGGTPATRTILTVPRNTQPSFGKLSMDMEGRTEKENKTRRIDREDDETKTAFPSRRPDWVSASVSCSPSSFEYEWLQTLVGYQQYAERFLVPLPDPKLVIDLHAMPHH